jgi:hypothetical protein
MPISNYSNSRRVQLINETSKVTPIDPKWFIWVVSFETILFTHFIKNEFF